VSTCPIFVTTFIDNGVLEGAEILNPCCEDTFVVPSSAGDGARSATSISAASVAEAEAEADLDIKQAGRDIVRTEDEDEDEDKNVHLGLTQESHGTGEPTPPSRVGHVYFADNPSKGSSTSAAAVVTPSPVYVQRRADLKTDAYWSPAATAAIDAARKAGRKHTLAVHQQMEEQRKQFPPETTQLSARKTLPKIDVKVTLARSAMTQEARKQTLKFREEAKRDGTDMWLAAAGTSGDELQPQKKPDPAFMSKRENEFALMYIAREKLLAGDAEEGEVALEGALREATEKVTTFGDTGNEFHHIRDIIYGIPYTKTTYTFDRYVRYFLVVLSSTYFYVFISSQSVAAVHSDG